MLEQLGHIKSKLPVSRTMESVRNCRECLLGFKQVGFLSARERIKEHEEIIHSIECNECSRKFISQAHLWFHIESFHDTKCGDCISFCENKCTIDYAKEVELRNEKVMEAGLVEKAEAAATAAEDLERCIKKKIKLYTPLALDMTRLLDTGFDGPEASHWSRVIYLPAAKTSEKPLSEKVKEWVKLTELESAFDEQTVRIRNTEVRECPISRCRASVFDEWEHRWTYHPDSSSRYWRSGSEAGCLFICDFLWVNAIVTNFL